MQGLGDNYITSMYVKKVLILRQTLGYLGILDLTQTLDQVFKLLARGQNPACTAILSGCKDILSIMKNLSVQETFVALVECNISRNNHIR